MQRPEHSIGNIDFPGRYFLDEARFPGRQEQFFSKEESHHEPPARNP